MTTTNATEAGLWEGQEHLTSEEIQRRVRELGPLIAAEADAVSQRGHMTERLKDALRDAGVFRINFPRAWGGPQMRVDDQIELVEYVARHDASAGWNVMILVDGGIYATQLGDPATARELYPTMDLATSATAFPVGRAEEVPGGYKLSGRWAFGSGVRDADRAVCGFHRYDADGNVDAGADGQPRLWDVWVPVDRLTIHDTWYTTGLEGTGSADFSVADDVVVPASHMLPHVSGPKLDVPPLGRYPLLIAANQLGVVLGLARHALDEFRGFIERARNTSSKAAKTEPTTLMALGEAEGHYRAARAYALATFGDVTDTLWEDRLLTAEQQGTMASTMTMTARLCREAVELVMEAAGSRAVLASNPFDRIYRDMATAGRHLLFRRKFYEVSGRRYLELDELGVGRLS